MMHLPIIMDNILLKVLMLMVLALHMDTVHVITSGHWQVQLMRVIIMGQPLQLQRTSSTSLKVIFPIVLTFLRGQPLYKGHHLRPQIKLSYIVLTILTAERGQPLYQGQNCWY